MAQQKRIGLWPRLRASRPAVVFKTLVKRSADAAVERYLNVRTGGSTLATHTKGGVHEDSNWYEPLNYITLEKCLDALNLRPDDVVFDIGCGLGRVLCALARRPIKKCVGIDLSEEFVAMARANLARARGLRASAEALVADAALADYDEGTAFYLYNSFGATTMAFFLQRLRDSVSRRPRPIRVIYVNPMQNHVFEQAGWLRRGNNVRSIWYEMYATLWQYEPKGEPVGKQIGIAEGGADSEPG